MKESYELSRMEHRSRCQGKEIDELVLKGNSVVYVNATRHCGFTDAVISQEKEIVAIFTVEEDALDYYNRHEESYAGDLDIEVPKGIEMEVDYKEELFEEGMYLSELYEHLARYRREGRPTEIKSVLDFIRRQKAVVDDLVKKVEEGSK